MPAFNRVVLAGTLGVTAEQWSVSCAYWSDLAEPVSTSVGLQTWAEAIAAGLTTAPPGASLRQAMSVQCGIRQVRTYFYPSTAAPAGTVGAASMTQDGTSTSIHPYPTSVVCTLQTALAGRRHRGRFYWPGLGLTIAGNGRIGGTDVGNMAVAFADLLERIGEYAGGPDPLRPAVVSTVGDEVTPVTSVRVGDVPDTQRRRRNNLVEAYQTAPVA